MALNMAPAVAEVDHRGLEHCPLVLKVSLHTASAVSKETQHVYDPG